MDASDRSRKRRGEPVVATTEEPESVPPPARRRRVRNELDPELLWDKETDEASDEYEADDDGYDDSDEEGFGEEGASEDFDDWDHPLRRLKLG